MGDWGLGIGDWGLGIGPNPQSPIPNPQSPIPMEFCYKKYINYKKIIYKNIIKLIIILIINLNNKTIKKLLNSSFKILDYNKLRFKPIF